jgi:hypothetical protein
MAPIDIFEERGLVGITRGETDDPDAQKQQEHWFARHLAGNGKLGAAPVRA